MFTKLDANWERMQIFTYFSEMAPTGYSITVKMDVTHLYEAVKKAGIKFFPAYLWLVTKNLNSQIAFKCALQEGKLGYFDTLTPLYASFHEDDHTFSFLWTPYEAEFSIFYQNYLNNQQIHGMTHGILGDPTHLPPPNAYTVSCIPWVAFDHFSVHSYENKPYYFPSVEAGKFFIQDGKRLMPLSLTCHHATTDGYHVQLFLRDLQMDMDRFEAFLP